MHATEEITPVSAVQVGLGGWGTDWALRVLPSAPGVRLVGWADPDPDARAAFAAAAGVPRVHCGLADALADVDAEAVFVTADPAAHGELARAALTAGKHVLLDRPFTPDLAEAADLVKLAEDVGKALLVAQPQRYTAASSQVRHLLAQEVVGRARHVAVAFRRNRRTPGSVLWRVSVDHFDLLRAFFGEASAVTARAWPRGQSRDGGLASFSAEIEFASGVIAQYSASTTSPAPATRWTGDWAVEGDDGVLHWSGSEPGRGVRPLHPRGRRGHRGPGRRAARARPLGRGGAVRPVGAGGRRVRDQRARQPGHHRAGGRRGDQHGHGERVALA
ncbi:Gfo/Idh/MocA family protein [Actinokineospora soli]|uniref:Gfo/Idh/MocA family protein n=1 Tax=Actinokineospora soli TaxID=1048753 RepID=A0ABW2TLE7_9PSEU